MEDTNAKKYILKKIHFPNMKSIFEKYVKSDHKNGIKNDVK